MKRLKIICFYFAFVIALCAQNGVLVFPSTNHNFGLIDTKTHGNVITCSFPFVNQGSDAVTISKVIISTSKIQVDYPDSPIQPNGKGVITVKYDLSSDISSMLRYSQPTKPFRKVITILSNSKQRNNRIFISGSIKANLPEEQMIKEKDGFIWYRTFRNGKFGVKDINGKEIIPAEYEKISYYYHKGDYIAKGFKVIGNNYCEGFYSITGKNVIDISRGYKFVYKINSKQFGTYYAFKKDGVAGFCNVNGKEVIRFPFSYSGKNSLIPCYNGGKFYVKYLITMKDDFDLDYLYRTGETDSNMGSGIIDGNGNTIVDLVKGFITLNKETSFFEYYDDKENRTISCGKLSDIKTTKNPLATNLVELH